MIPNIIKTDIVQKIYFTEAVYKQYDSGQVLNVEVLANGQKYSLAGYTGIAIFKIPNMPLEQRNCEISDNIVTINLDNYLLGYSGIVKFELIFNKGSETTTTGRLHYKVEPSYDANGAITTEPHWDIVQGLVDVTPENFVTREEYEAAMVNIANGLPVDLSQYLKKTELHEIASSGDYNDLINKPTRLSQFQNDLDLGEGGGSGGTIIGGSGYGVIAEGNNIMSATQPNDVLEIEGVGIDVELIRRATTNDKDKLRLSKTDTFFNDILDKPFESLSSDFIVDESGIVSIDRNKVGGSAGGGMPFINIMSFKVWEPVGSEYVETTYSALGDNYTSGVLDTLAIERAFRLAKDNGSVNIYIPDGKFILNQTIQLYPNTNVQMSRNAVIRKNHDNPMFSNSQPNEYFLGYSGRGKIYWTGGTLDSKDATGKARSGSTFSLVNAEYFEFKSMIFLDQRNTHHFDLSGIRNIVMSECYFYGYTYDVVDDNGVAIPQDKIRAYSECIQIDYSSHQAMPSQITGHDGTACQFVFVQKCKFDKSDNYPSWNRAIGMHNVYFPTYNWLCNTNGTLTGNNFNFEYSKAKNMYITDNEIYGNGTIIHDYYTIDGTTGEKIYDPQSYIIQQIRLLNVDNVYISGNKFENVKGGVSFDCDQSSKTMIDTDAQRDFTTTNSGHLMPYSVEWTDNRGDKQKILYSESTSDKGTKITTYTQYGKTYTITWAKTSKVLDYYGISNCHVINNTFKNITAGVRDTNGVATYQPSTPIYVRGECRTKASATLQGTRANKVIIMGNIIDGIETVPVEAQSRAASAKGLVVSPPGTTGAAWSPNIVSAISATYTRNLTVIGNEVRNCSRAIFTSGCNRALIANNQIFTVVDTEAIGIVGGGIYLVTGNIMDNLFDSAIRMKGTDQFFVEGNIITNTNKGSTWTIDVPFFQYNPKDKPTIWVEVDGSGGSNYGSVSNNKIYSSFTSNFIKYPVYIGNENTYIKSAGNFYFGTFQFKNNTDLNFSDCGLDTAFRGNDAETLNGKSFDTMKDTFVQHTDKGIPNGVASLGADGKIPSSQLPTTSGGGSGFKTLLLPNNEQITATSLANSLTFQGSNGITFDAKDGNVLEILFDANGSHALRSNNIEKKIDDHLVDEEVHVTPVDKENWNKHIDLLAGGIIGGADYHVTKGQKDSWDSHIIDGNIHVTINDKDYWNTHASDSTIHVTSEDTNNWNSHVIDNTIHVTPTDTNSWNTHRDDLNIHVTTGDKNNWNGKSDLSHVNNNFLNKTGVTKQIVTPEVQFDNELTVSGYKEKIGDHVNGALDFRTGNIFSLTPSANTTISFANTNLTTTHVHSIVIYITFGATLYTVTMPVSVKWHANIIPAFKTNKTHEIVLRTINGGTTWFASVVGEF